jgi:hypothetical protein
MSADNFLEQLGEVDVPPPPAEFDAQLHDRVNESLVGLQLAEFLVHALPAAILEMARALAGAVSFTVTGRYDGDRK